MVSNRRLRYPDYSFIRVVLGCFRPARGSDAYWLENYDVSSRHGEAPSPLSLYPDFRVVSVLGLVV